MCGGAAKTRRVMRVCGQWPSLQRTGLCEAPARAGPQRRLGVLEGRSERTRCGAYLSCVCYRAGGVLSCRYIRCVQTAEGSEDKSGCVQERNAVRYEKGEKPCASMENKPFQETER